MTSTIPNPDQSGRPDYRLALVASTAIACATFLTWHFTRPAVQHGDPTEVSDFLTIQAAAEELKRPRPRWSRSQYQTAERYEAAVSAWEHAQAQARAIIEQHEKEQGMRRLTDEPFFQQRTAARKAAVEESPYERWQRDVNELFEADPLLRSLSEEAERSEKRREAQRRALILVTGISIVGGCAGLIVAIVRYQHRRHEGQWQALLNPLTCALTLFGCIVTVPVVVELVMLDRLPTLQQLGYRLVQTTIVWLLALVVYASFVGPKGQEERQTDLKL